MLSIGRPTRRSNSLLSADSRRTFVENKGNRLNIESSVKYNNLNSSCVSFLSSQSEKQHSNHRNLSISSLKTPSNLRDQSRQSSIHKITKVSIGNCVSDLNEY